MKLVVQQAAFAADEMDMEIIRLEAIDDGNDLADATVLEAENGHAGRRILVLGKFAIRRMG